MFPFVSSERTNTGNNETVVTIIGATVSRTVFIHDVVRFVDVGSASVDIAFFVFGGARNKGDC